MAISVPIYFCKQCGGRHSGLFFRDLGDGAYEGLCPTKRQAIKLSWQDPNAKVAKRSAA